MNTMILEEKPKVRTDLSDIVRDYAEELPRTGWLTRLHLTRPRQNLTCLPLSTRYFKRTVDIVGSLALMVLLSPVILLTAVLVKLTSRGPVIYNQTRVGLNLRSKKKDRRQSRGLLPPGYEDRRVGERRVEGNYGRLFTIYKFRTMRTDAEAQGAQFATEADPRVTPIGRLLRRTRIDELPQLWNVLRGDMSLVGPRPERPQFMEQLSDEIPNYVDRLGLKPGLTGMAQVVNGYDNEIDGFRRKVGYDLLYLQNCCVANDLKIMARTIRVVVTGEGAL
ncbi:MAG: sugar transferase [Planctomycetaceae bacterium]|nr:sugar transferase [Planctomycetaceae bacterium]